MWRFANAYRTNYAKEISATVYETYATSVKVFKTEIPISVRTAETSLEGSSIYKYDPRGKAAYAYSELTKEVLNG